MSTITRTLGDTIPIEGKNEGVLVGHFILGSLPSAAGPMVKTASSGQAVMAAVKAFLAALETVSASTSLAPGQVAELDKTAMVKDEVQSKDMTVRIASKTVKDSHYFMDVSLDPISKGGKSLVMVSFLLREGVSREVHDQEVLLLPPRSHEGC